MNSKYKENIVFITTANVIFKHVDDFARNAKVDVLIVDEGHKAKNINTRIRQGIKNLYVRRHKIILTGTPVQNNLTEFYSLMDIIEDDIFGTPTDFTEKYRSKIEAGLKKRALYKNMVRAQELIQELKSIYKPHFLRRTKKEIFEIKSAELSEEPLEACQLPLKTDLVIWIPLNAIQKKIYSLILEEDEVDKAMKQVSKKHIFIVILALKHLCVHPFILLHSFCNKLFNYLLC